MTDTGRVSNIYRKIISRVNGLIRFINIPSIAPASIGDMHAQPNGCWKNLEGWLKGPHGQAHPVSAEQPSRTKRRRCSSTATMTSSHDRWRMVPALRAGIETRRSTYDATDDKGSSPIQDHRVHHRRDVTPVNVSSSRRRGKSGQHELQALRRGTQALLKADGFRAVGRRNMQDLRPSATACGLVYMQLI
jgi:hypothetical protein